MIVIDSSIFLFIVFCICCWIILEFLLDSPYPTLETRTKDFKEYVQQNPHMYVNRAKLYMVRYSKDGSYKMYSVEKGKDDLVFDKEATDANASKNPTYDFYDESRQVWLSRHKSNIKKYTLDVENKTITLEYGLKDGGGGDGSTKEKIPEPIVVQLKNPIPNNLTISSDGKMFQGPIPCEELTEFTFADYADMFNVSILSENRDKVVDSKQYRIKCVQDPVTGTFVPTIDDTLAGTGLHNNGSTKSYIASSSSSTSSSSSSVGPSTTSLYKSVVVGDGKRENVSSVTTINEIENPIYPSCIMNYDMSESFNSLTRFEQEVIACPYNQYKYKTFVNNDRNWVEKISPVPVIVIGKKVIYKWDNIPASLAKIISEKTAAVKNTDDDPNDGQCIAVNEDKSVKIWYYVEKDDGVTRQYVAYTVLMNKILLDYTTVTVLAKTTTTPPIRSDTKYPYLATTDVFHLSKIHSIFEMENYIKKNLQNFVSQQQPPSTENIINLHYHCCNTQVEHVMHVRDNQVLDVAST